MTRHYSSDSDTGVMEVGTWGGDSGALEWAEFIGGCIRKKDVLLSQYKANADDCDLLIYDNSPTPPPDFQRGFALLDEMGVTHGFRRLSVIRGATVIYDLHGARKVIS